jgi:hypothetical protein
METETGQTQVSARMLASEPSVRILIHHLPFIQKTNDLSTGEGCIQANPDGEKFSGPLMRSRPFPVYTDGVYCPDDASWRIVYSLYYQNDYNHRHDWERAIVVFKKQGADDWWDRVALLLGQHSGYNSLKWSSATAHDDPYASSPDRGKNGAHPRVFPGMYHHAVSP